MLKKSSEDVVLKKLAEHTISGLKKDNKSPQIWTKGLYCDASLAVHIIDQLVLKNKELFKEVDFLCSIPNSGRIVASAIQQKLPFNIATYEEEDLRHKYKRNPVIPILDVIPKRGKVLLIDDMIETGQKLELTLETLKELNLKYKIKGLLVIIDNDVSPQKINSTKEKFIKNGMLFSLFKTSEFFKYSKYCKD